MRGQTIPIDQARHERVTRMYRNHIREMVQIAGRALAGQGERRATALADISRIGTKALREDS